MEILRISGLKKYFPIKKGFFNRTVAHVKAINDIEFEINEGETVGLVGESGCGKSTTGNCIVRLLEPTAGKIFYTERDGTSVDLAALSPAELKPYRREIQMVFQDPYSSLNPRMTVKDLIAEPLVINHMIDKRDAQDRVAAMMLRVGLRPEYMTRYPHAFSGGQRQRIGIARAISLNPRFVVCDEAVSSLDVSVQGQVLGLLEDLQTEFNMSYLFVAHDLSAVRHISDRVVVMYVGKVVEIAQTDELFENPRHPYTSLWPTSAGAVTRWRATSPTPPSRRRVASSIHAAATPPRRASTPRRSCCLWLAIPRDIARPASDLTSCHCAA